MDEVQVARRRRRSRWSWQIGSIAGIPIRVHVTLVLFLAWIALGSSFRGLGPSATVTGVVLVIVVFATILVHELGHALMARRFGVRTRGIVLLPIGGISNMERIPERPSQELAIALVGPAINLAIAGLLWLIVVLAGDSLDPRAATSLGTAFLVQLVWINLGLALFNLLPGFPLDGGRALRALLAMRLRRERATEIAAFLGKVVAVGLAVIGLWTNIWLVAIAFVIWFGASAEVNAMYMRAALAGVPVADAMLQERDSATLDEPLEQVAARLVSTGRGQIPIVDHGETVGVLTRDDISAGLQDAGANARVAAAPRHDVITVEPDAHLDRVLDQLQASPDAVAVVVDHGEPIGIVTPEQVAAFVTLHTPTPLR